MAEFERDQERLTDSLNRLRLSIRLAPFTFVALAAIVFGLLSASLGFVVTIVVSLMGAMLGFFFSQIVAAILESLGLLLIYLDRNDSSGRDGYD